MYAGMDILRVDGLEDVSPISYIKGNQIFINKALIEFS